MTEKSVSHLNVSAKKLNDAARVRLLDQKYAERGAFLVFFQDTRAGHVDNWQRWLDYSTLTPTEAARANQRSLHPDECVLDIDVKDFETGRGVIAKIIWTRQSITQGAVPAQWCASLACTRKPKAAIRRPL